MVQLVEGDPDRPIVVASVYNAEQIPPYLLPDHATVSTFRSRSSKQGVATNHAHQPTPHFAIKGMDAMVDEAIKNGQGADKLNVKLEPYRGKGLR